MNETAVVKFKKDKDTKNTVRYLEVPEKGQPPVCGTLYAQKWFAEGTDFLTVTIEKAPAPAIAAQ